MTPHQQQTSAEISRAIPDLPTTLSDLISEMAIPDFSSAMLPLEMDEDNQVIQSPQNLYIIACIELALTSSSSECDPKIKASIFCNAKGGIDPISVHPYLSRIILDLADRGQQINLDDVVLTDLDLSSNGRLHLGGMSAKRATFSNVNMRYASLDSADFTGAKFDNVCLSMATMTKANVTDALFLDLTLMYTVVNQLIGNQSVIFDSFLTADDYTLAGDMLSNRSEIAYLSGMYFDAVPNRTQFTLPAKKNISP